MGTVQKIISGNNINQGSVVFNSAGGATFEENLRRASINKIDLTAVAGRWDNRFSFYNSLTNESGNHKSFPASS